MCAASSCVMVDSGGAAARTHGFNELLRFFVCQEIARHRRHRPSAFAATTITATCSAACFAVAADAAARTTGATRATGRATASAGVSAATTCSAVAATTAIATAT